MKSFQSIRRVVGIALTGVLALLAGSAGALLGACGPFTDVAADAFCPFVLEVFYLGITTGTTPTTYDPASAVSRLQMAAFLSRGVDGVLKRGSRRAALKQFWTPQNTLVVGLTTVGNGPGQVQSDGADIWVANLTGGTVSRVRGSDGKLLETWTGATSARAPVAAAGRVFIAGGTTPGRLYRIDPAQPAGAVTTLASNLGDTPADLTFDGNRFWTANGNGPSVSIVTPAAGVPWPVTTVGTGFTLPIGLAYDGANVWVTDGSVANLLKLDAGGAILQTVTVGTLPNKPVFDGANIWVPNSASNSISVVRASSGAVLQTLTGNGLDFPSGTAFDGQRVLVTNPPGDTVSLWKAADLTPLGVFGVGTGTSPAGACSDGVNFWIALNAADRVARF